MADLLISANDKVYAVKRFRPPPMSDLLNPSMERWVHHTSHILRQGRTTWWNPAKGLKKPTAEDEDEEDIEEEEEEEEDGEAGREFGPALFGSLAEDKTLDGITPWSPRASSTVFTEFQVASVRSNLWPGATAMCTSKYVAMSRESAPCTYFYNGYVAVRSDICYSERTYQLHVSSFNSTHTLTSIRKISFLAQNLTLFRMVQEYFLI